MKAILRAGFLWFAAWSCLGSDLKIATVDLQQVLAGYHKAQEAMEQFKQKQSSFLKELEGLRLEGRKLMQETESLREFAADQALSAAARAEKKKDLEARLTNLRAFEVRYDDFRAQREADLQLQLARSNKRILEEVMSATRSLGEKEGFNLILNANKTNPATSDVLFSKNIDDLTAKITLSLNSARPQPREVAPDRNVK